jgi:predicted DNA-binding protein (MmcQ/YjbR family)
MPPSPLARLRRICLALPAAHEVEAWGEPTFRVRNKLFAMYAGAGNHHGAGRPAVWCKAGPGNQELMVGAEPHRYFSPPYVGKSGWVGIWLDRGVDWGAVGETLADAHALIAPKAKRAAAPSPARAATPKAVATGRGLPAGLGKPATRALAGAGITSLAGAARRTEQELAALHGVGPKAIGILRSSLQATGRTFRKPR